MAKNVTSTKEVKMFRRDFTKSNKEYFKKNKFLLIGFAAFLLIGVIIFSIFGMNGNFEVKGCYEFNATVTENHKKDFNDYRKDIGEIINSYNGNFDTMLIMGEGDNTQFVVRYTKTIDDKDIVEINKLVAEELDINVEDISEHVKVKPVIKNTDYLYAAVAILLLIVIATIFAYVRYNGASAITIMLACLLGTLSFMSIGAILRLTIGMSYLAMLTILNMLIIYSTISTFEDMHKSKWMAARDFATAIKSSIKSSMFRFIFVAFALLIIGIVLIMFAPANIKYVSLNVMFMSVVFLAVALYIVPFVWSVFITRTRLRDYKIKAEKSETK